jgi:penicillin-binding protein 2
MISGLFDVYNFGTANALRVEGIDITMVKQVATERTLPKLTEKSTAKRDHSIFVAFAPKENPKIAIAITSRKWWI